ncbi:hypothetical protein TNCV_3585161 [Trichonephila clavipes]|nr:hypothetical protein TNCV_3585161 [Trichonephila clavipes]
MVIIKEDNLPSCQWSLGRINNIYPGKDSKLQIEEKSYNSYPYNIDYKTGWAVGSLLVRASDSRPEGLCSMPDATKYPPSTHGVRTR